MSGVADDTTIVSPVSMVVAALAPDIRSFGSRKINIKTAKCLPLPCLIGIIGKFEAGASETPNFSYECPATREKFIKKAEELCIVSEEEWRRPRGSVPHHKRRMDRQLGRMREGQLLRRSRRKERDLISKIWVPKNKE